MVVANNLIIKLLAAIFAAISVIIILFVAAVGGLVYAFLWLVGALAVLIVSVYQWWVRILTDVKGLGSADTE